jgi:hypothetical protein
VTGAHNVARADNSDPQLMVILVHEIVAIIAAGNGDGCDAKQV